MKMSTLFGRTLREAPSDAEHIAHQLVLRAGLARALQAGSYALLPLGMRVARRIESVMHEEMARIDAQEFRTPVIQSSESWEQTGRYQAYGPLMLRLADRSERSLIVAPTHEEAVAEVARHDISSYRQLPALLYQIHTKYRDEPRARGGMMRMREFTMLDAYSLDRNVEGLDHSFEQVAEAFERILRGCCIDFIAVEAASGEMGGGESREYVSLSSAGEDTLALCDTCDYAANVEIATSAMPERITHTDVPMKEAVATPNCETIVDVASFLDVPTSETAKAVFFDTPERGLLFVVIRGDLEVNETKLRAAAGVSELAPASDRQIMEVGAVPGYASPVDLEGVTVIADRSVPQAGPLVAGANRTGYHLRNVLYGRDWEATEVADIAMVRAADPCPHCGQPLRLERGIEIAHIFKLGTKYTEALGATFLDQSGKAQPIVMGSYGIGIERLLQVLVEQHHDEDGIIWPTSVAPFDVYLLHIGKSEEVQSAAEALYTELKRVGLRVLWDDRDERAGVKFNDADLIGLPLRLVMSQRLLEEQQVEIKPRTGEATEVARENVIAAVDNLINQMEVDDIIKMERNL
ncbi:MAG: proline--tRNA ligase [Chloroflexota bacterium]|nr:proline--tRNA ligase [Chloroflexota bacterium]